MMKLISKYFPVIILILAVLSRLVPHIPNFTPIAAMALFGGFYMKGVWRFFPISVMILSDIILQSTVLSNWGGVSEYFSTSTPWSVYISFLVIMMIGVKLKNVTLPNVLAGGLVGAVSFFIITNFFVWFSSSLYPASFLGLVECYVFAIPFFHNTLMGDLFFGTIMFSLCEFAFRLTQRFAYSKV